MVRRGTSRFIPVIVLLLFALRVSCSLTSDASKNNAGKQENIDDTRLPAEHRVKRGVGDELNALKDKAKKANSAYGWLKQNWKKLFIIIVAIFALIAVVGIYRRCVSDSGSGGDDEEPNIVVVRMLKQENKGNGGCLDPVLGGEITEQGGGTGKKITGHGYATHKCKKRDTQTVRTTKEMTSGGRTQKVAVTSIIQQHHEELKAPFTSPRRTDLPTVLSKSSSCFQGVRLDDFQMKSIPISGYISFQQIEFSMIYFYFIHCLLEATKADQRRLTQPTRISKGSTSKGPFPVYEEIPLINILIAALIEKYRDDYIPTANTNTKLPLTVSP